MSKKGFVYVLQNEAMPGLIKIGLTQEEQVESRVQKLYTTGVPLPFDCIWAGIVDDCKEIEGIVHNAFEDHRINPKREFFKLKPERVVPILKKLAVKEVEASRIEKILNGSLSKIEKEAKKQFRRPVLNFRKMGIPIGAKLFFIHDKKIVIRVVADKRVEYQGETYALSALTKKLKNLPYYVAPCRFWLYKGTNLSNIYDCTYSPRPVK